MRREMDSHSEDHILTGTRVADIREVADYLLFAVSADDVKIPSGDSNSELSRGCPVARLCIILRKTEGECGVAHC